MDKNPEKPRQLSKKARDRLATAATIDLAGYSTHDTSIIVHALETCDKLAAAIATCYDRGETCITLADAEAMLKSGE
nr:hypothetical protein [Candidatus Sigynarchaeum springense]